MAKERVYTEGEMKSAERLLAQAKRVVAEIEAKIKRLEAENKKYQAELKNKLFGTAHKKELIKYNNKEIEKLKAQKVAAAKEVANKRGYLVRIQNFFIKQGKIQGKNAQNTEEVKSQVKTDSENANVAKKRVRSSKRPPQKTVNKAKNPAMPKEVEAQMNKLGIEYKLITREDSQGNRIYIFENLEHKAYVMTQLKNQEAPSAIIDSSSAEMRALRKQIAAATGKVGKSNISEIIGQINQQANRELLNAGQKEAKEGFKALTELKIDKENIDNFKPSFATVTLVPHTKKNGKLSKHKYDIQLKDADGKIFTLTKKDMKKAIKQKGNSVVSRAEIIDSSWDNYIQAAKEGRLTPETVASFFKDEKPNLGENVKSTTDQSLQGRIPLGTLMSNQIKTVTDQSLQGRIPLVTLRLNQIEKIEHR